MLISKNFKTVNVWKKTQGYSVAKKLTLMFLMTKKAAVSTCLS